MKPETAVSLVTKYATISKAIAACKTRIGEHLDLCNGLKGFRREMESHEGYDGGPMVGWIEPYETHSERSADDQETHLKGWYDYSDRAQGYDGELEPIGELEREQCPHCYAAHLVVQERKELRRQLGAVKSTMTRIGAPHD